jgi:hypothetical protein
VYLLYTVPSSAEEGLFPFFLELVILVLAVLQFILLPLRPGYIIETRFRGQSEYDVMK